MVHLIARFTAAIIVSIPIAAIVWFEVAYLWFGATGGELRGAGNGAIAALALAGSVTWSIYHADGVAHVVHRACRLGIAVAIVLPIIAVAVLLLWANATGRPDLGMGGLMLYSLPVVAFVAAIVLVVVFGIGRRLAAKRMPSL